MWAPKIRLRPPLAFLIRRGSFNETSSEDLTSLRSVLALAITAICGAIWRQNHSVQRAPGHNRLPAVPFGGKTADPVAWRSSFWIELFAALYRLLQEEDPSFDQFTASGDFSFGTLQEERDTFSRATSGDFCFRSQKCRIPGPWKERNKVVGFLFRRSLGEILVLCKGHCTFSFLSADVLDSIDSTEHGAASDPAIFGLVGSDLLHPFRIQTRAIGIALPNADFTEVDRFEVILRVSTVDRWHGPLTVQIDQLICSSLVHFLDDEGAFPIRYEFATNFSVWDDWSSQHQDQFPFLK
ncbi:hypothetical protein KFK09_011716 [Dendrobium nobile]|uniref:Uncharacterized protein n=1 Tax=Dendrobium nobile TaxID=94219 RepID=A0A8T3BFC3_DENNO|nr:hypothetical protein KFK09_011716 [Dendrobium nobile]